MSIELLSLAVAGSYGALVLASGSCLLLAFKGRRRGR